MKKHFLLVIVLALLLINSMYACDLCSIYKGLEPNDFKNSFGVRYRYRLFESKFTFETPTFSTANVILGGSIKGIPSNKHLEPTFIESKDRSDFVYTESYTSYAIFANFYLNHRLKLNVSTYFSDNYTYKNDSLLENVSGIGDITLLANYQLYNTKKTDTTHMHFSHRVMVGGGIIVPTGNFNKKTIVGVETEIKPNIILGTPIQSLDPHLQAGTGAFGLVFLTEYLVKYRKIGVNTNLSYRKNLVNKNDFQFADRFNANSNLFYILKFSDKISVMPTVGLAFETAKRDSYKNEPFIGSGGNVLFLNYGLSFNYKDWSLSSSYYNVISENLKDLQPSNKNRIIIQLSYYFN